MRIIILNDGTRHNVDFCGEADGILRIRLTDTQNLIPTVIEFSDKTKTSRIVNTRNEGKALEFVYEGYTDLFSVELDEIGTKIALRLEN